MDLTRLNTLSTSRLLYIGTLAPEFIFVPQWGYDPKEAVETAKKANANAVMFEAWDRWGNALYDTKLGHKHAKIHGDLLREVVEAAHDSGLKVFSCVLIFDPLREASIDPSWMAKDAKGESLHYPCCNSPFKDEIAIPQIMEVTENYDIDGWFFDEIFPGCAWINSRCWCDFCKQMFRQEYDADLPKSHDDPMWVEFGEWSRRCFTNFMEELYGKIKSIKPHISIGYNWAYSIIQPDAPDSFPIDYCNYDFCEGNFIYPLNISLGSKYLLPPEIYYKIWTSWTNQAWIDWTLKTVNALKLDCATMLANGSMIIMGGRRYPDGKIEPVVWDYVGEAFKFLAEREEYCIPSESVPYIAVIHSSTSFYLKEGGNLTAEWKPLSPIRGAHKALVESALHFDIVNEKMLIDKISSYKALVLPNQLSLSYETVEAIKRFVKNGGGLLACQSNPKDENGRPIKDFALADVFGVSYHGLSPYGTGYIRSLNKNVIQGAPNIVFRVEGPFTLVKRGKAEELARLIYPSGECSSAKPYEGKYFPPGSDSGYPAITINTYGKGKAIYVTSDIFSDYLQGNYVWIRYLIANLMNQVIREKILIVDAPPSVEVTLRKKGERTIIQLVNFHEGKRTVEVAPQIDWMPTITDVEVKLKVAEDPKVIYTVPEKTKLNWKRDGGYIRFISPEFKIHQCIVIE